LIQFTFRTQLLNAGCKRTHDTKNRAGMENVNGAAKMVYGKKIGVVSWLVIK
jgi:hypothetical protein